MSANVKITELPSGNFNAKVFDYTDSLGKRHYKSITAPSKREVKQLIAEFIVSKDEKKATVTDMTVGEAIDKYVSTKANVLSPSTVRGYLRMRKNNLQNLINVRLKNLTAEDVQIEINNEALKYSPKTIRNMHGLLSAVLSVYAPGLKLNTTLPQREKNEMKIPNEDEIRKILEEVKGKELEVPIYLAAFCGMRESEIGALKWDDINLKNRTMIIRQAMVLNTSNEYVYKTTKSVAGTRRIPIFDNVLKVLEAVPDKKGNITQINPHNMHQRFVTLQHRIGIVPHYRFHDLRHYTVSVMLSLNIPKNYIADFIGHESEHLIEKVYGHIMQSAKVDFMQKANEYFSNSTVNAPRNASQIL